MNKLARFPLAAMLCLFLLTSPLFAQSSQDDKQPSSSSSSSTSSSSQSSSSPSSSSSSSSPAWYSPSRYNPAKLFKRDAKSADDQLAANEELEQKLTGQLRAHGVLDKTANLQDKCSIFKSLQTCIAVIRASKSLTVDFACLKWDVTGVKPEDVSNACAGPSDGKAMSFRDSISLLKPDADAKEEAAKALKEAHDDIKDAS